VETIKRQTTPCAAVWLQAKVRERRLGWSQACAHGSTLAQFVTTALLRRNMRQLWRYINEPCLYLLTVSTLHKIIIIFILITISFTRIVILVDKEAMLLRMAVSCRCFDNI